MPLVLIHAQAPWGPISFRVAESMGELLDRLTREGGQAPAHIEDVGDRDPAEVVKLALRSLPPPMDASGQLPTTVAKARNSIVEAVSRAPAMVVAERSAIDSPGSNGGNCGAVGSSLVAVPDSASSRPRIHRRAGEEIDVRAIRAGLGMSQAEFAEAFAIPVGTLRDWEQGRYKLEGATRVLLMTIAHRPDAVRSAIALHGLPA